MDAAIVEEVHPIDNLHTIYATWHVNCPHFVPPANLMYDA
jgi:hypothetical protein